MSISNEYYRAQMLKEQALLAQQREVDMPDFNQWVKALENDPEYLEKNELRLDKELGKDRLI